MLYLFSMLNSYSFIFLRAFLSPSMIIHVARSDRITLPSSAVHSRIQAHSDAADCPSIASMMERMTLEIADRCW